MKVGLLDGLVSHICTVPVHTVQWYSNGTFRNYTEYIASIEVQCDTHISPPPTPWGLYAWHGVVSDATYLLEVEFSF